MEEFERQRGNLLLDKALAVIWNEIHRLHDDIEFMMDLIRNVKEHVDQALPPFNLSTPPSPTLLYQTPLFLLPQVLSKFALRLENLPLAVFSFLSFVTDAGLSAYPQIINTKIPRHPLLWDAGM